MLSPFIIFAALVEALKVAENNHVSRSNISLVISVVARREEGRVALIAGGACAALVHALKVAEPDATTGHLAFAMYSQNFYD